MIWIRKTILGVSLFCCFALTGQAQNFTFTLNQPSSLIVDAGPDTTILKGNSIRLGGNPTALEGYGSYVYSWSPVTGLDDPTAANPIATPLEETTYILTVIDDNNCQQQDEITVGVDASGIIEWDLEESIAIYPNPNPGILHIRFIKPVRLPTIKIYSMLGELLWQKKFQGLGSGQVEVDLSAYSTGLYLISVSANNQQTIRRVLLL